jgi:hypothetical protein
MLKNKRLGNIWFEAKLVYYIVMEINSLCEATLKNDGSACTTGKLTAKIYEHGSKVGYVFTANKINLCSK